MYDFKKYFIWCFWLTLYLLFSWYFCIFAVVGFDYLFFDLTGSYYLNFLNELNISISIPCDLTIFSFACLWISSLFNRFSLHIYSYHVYLGRRNWYKFFNEREKQQKKKNSQDWKIYCKSLKG